MSVRALILATIVASACSSKRAGEPAAALDASPGRTPRAQALIEAAEDGKPERLTRALGRGQLTAAEVDEVIRAAPASVRRAAFAALVRAPGGLPRFIELAPKHPEEAVGGFEQLWGAEPVEIPESEMRQLIALGNHSALADQIARLGLVLGDAGRLVAGDFAEVQTTMLVAYPTARERQVAARKAAVEWWADERYREAAGIVNSYLSVFRFFPSYDVGEYLEEAIRDDDIYTAEYAVITSVGLGRHVDAAVIDEMAGHDTIRSELHVWLEVFGELHRIPDAWKTPLALARGDLAQWVMWNTETFPAELELMEKVGELYVFRFREEGGPWLAGVAGPYPGPEYAVYGARTGSLLERAESRTPAEHARVALERPVTP